MFLRNFLRGGVFFLASLLSAVALAEQYFVAAGQVAVTPPNGTYLAGYGRDRTSSGVLDDIFIKGVVIESEGARLALLTIDNIGLTRPDIMRIRTGVTQLLPGMQVVVSSTHTHAGPDVVGIWGPQMWRSGKDPAYLTALVTKAVDLVSDLAGKTVPALSQVATRQVPLDWVENVSEPELLDATLSVMSFTDRNGQTIATLTNYACHPTILGPDNTLVSADYLSGFYRRMGEAHATGVHLFLQGAIGGWVQPVQGDRSAALGDQLGASLAEQAIDLLAAASANPYQPLNFIEQELDIKLDNWGFRLLIWLGVLERELFAGAMRTSVAWFQIGDARFITHPGETSPAYSLASRKLMNTSHSFVLGLTQDAIGYILKPDYFTAPARYPHGEYLVSVSVGESAGPQVMAAVQQVARQGIKQQQEQKHEQGHEQGLEQQ